jgi:predicted amidophosphoribosyltransferase
VRFLYKIFSGYNGFTPSRIESRLLKGDLLELGWARYLDSVSIGDECWVYFHGPHAFTPGVYIKGFIRRIDFKKSNTLLRVREYHSSVPLVEDKETAGRIAQTVATRYRQVFLWPEESDATQCSVTSCGRRKCGSCETWRALPIIQQDHARAPRGCVAAPVVPAYWVIPARCYVQMEGRGFAAATYSTTNMFEEFKFGERRYAYPLARGIYEALRRREALDFDAIVPIPLSPDKLASKELHRTRALAQELGELLGVRVRELLSLSEPISKRRMKSYGYTKGQFETRYYSLLVVDPSVANCEHILLVDDAITHGSTIRMAALKLYKARPELNITAASAAQMIVKAAVASEAGFVQ